MKLKNKILIPTLSVLSIGTTIALPITLTSCSSGGPSAPIVDQLKPADTSNITTFSQAQTFLKEYMKKNYKKEALLSDMIS